MSEVLFVMLVIYSIGYGKSVGKLSSEGIDLWTAFTLSLVWPFFGW
jgi:hypothetical protein